MKNKILTKEEVLEISSVYLLQVIIFVVQMNQEDTMKLKILMSILAMLMSQKISVSPNYYASKKMLSYQSENNTIYKNISLQANSFQKDGGGFFNIPFPLTPYDATTY